MINWISNNKQWLFSGVGLAVITGLLGFNEIRSDIKDGEPSDVRAQEESPANEYDPKSDTPYYVLGDKSYLYSVQEPMRAIAIYRDAYTISSAAIDEADLTIKSLRASIDEFENKQEEMTSSDIENVNQMKINLQTFTAVKKSLLKVVKEKQDHLALIASMAENRECPQC